MRPALSRAPPTSSGSGGAGGSSSGGGLVSPRPGAATRSGSSATAAAGSGSLGSAPPLASLAPDSRCSAVALPVPATARLRCTTYTGAPDALRAHTRSLLAAAAAAAASAPQPPGLEGLLAGACPLLLWPHVVAPAAAESERNAAPAVPPPITGKRKTRVAAASVSDASLAADASCSSSGVRTPAPAAAPRAPAKLCVFEVRLAEDFTSSPPAPDALQQHSCVELPLTELWDTQTPHTAAAVAPQHARLYRLLCRALRERAVREWARCSAVRQTATDEPRTASPPDASAMRVDDEREEGEEGETDSPAPAPSARPASLFLPLSHGLVQVPHVRGGEASPFAADPPCSFLQLRIALTPDMLHLSLLVSNCALVPFSSAASPARRTSVLLSPSGLGASYLMLHPAPTPEQAAPLQETLSQHGIALPSACTWALCARADPAGGDEHLFLYPTPLLLVEATPDQLRPSAALSAPRRTPAVPLRGLELATRAATELATDAAALLREAGAPLLQMPTPSPVPALKQPPAPKREGIVLPERTRPASHTAPEEPSTQGTDAQAGKDEDMAAAPALEKSEAPAEEDTSAGEDLWGDGSGDEDAAEAKMDDAGDASEEDDVPLASLHKAPDASKTASNGAEPDTAAEIRPENVALPASPQARATHTSPDGSAMPLLDSTMDLNAFHSYEAPAAGRKTKDDDEMSGLDDFGLTEDDFDFFDDGAATAAPQTEAPAADQSDAPAADADKEVPDEVFLMDLDGAGDTARTNQSPSAEGTWAGATPGPPTAPSGSSSEMISHSSTSASIGSGGGGSAMDPPSLPGFTPSSFFSASSPAFGGLLGKTPRTPFSPHEGDLHIGIVGADGAYGPLVRFGDAPHERRDEEGDTSGLPAAPGSPPQKKASAAMEALSQQQRLRDMSNKYHGGRFAPQPRHSAVAGSPDRQTGATHRPSLGRTLSLRAAHRRNENVAINATEWRPPPASPDEGKSRKRIASRGNGYTALSMPALHKLRLLDRAEEKDTMSEQDEASEDGSDDGADDDESSAGGSAAEEEEQQEEMLERRTERLLTAASDLLASLEMGSAAVQQIDAAPALELPSTVRPSNDSAASALSDDEEDALPTTPSPAELENERDRRWDILVKWLASNPQMRHTAMHGPGRRSAHPLAPLVPALHCSAAVCGLEALMGTPASLAALLGATPDGEATDSGADTAASSTPTRFEVLEGPELLVGCQGSVTRIAPTALRFWDKLGLSAAGGPRRVTAFALHMESAPSSQASEVARWLGRLEKTFSMLGLGTHEASPDHVLALAGEAGIAQSILTVSSDAETWNDTLDSIVSRMKPYLGPGRHVVLYATGIPVWPIPFHAFVRLQDGLRRMARRTHGAAGDQISVRPVPMLFVAEASLSAGLLSAHSEFDLRRFALSVYEELRVAVAPARPCPPSHAPPRGRQDAATPLLQYPAFTLDAAHAASPRFELAWPRVAINVLRRGALLHVCYDTGAQPDDPVLVSIIDEQGQTCEMRSWRKKGSAKADAEAVWRAVLHSLRKTSAELRIVVCKAAAMEHEELQAWTSLASQHVSLDVTLMCSDASSSLALAAAQDLPARALALRQMQRTAPLLSDAGGAVLLDGASSSYALYPTRRFPVWGSQAPEEPMEEDAGADAAPTSPPLLSLASSLTVRLPRAWDGSSRNASGSGHTASDVRHAGAAPRFLWLHLLAIFPSSRSGAPTAPPLDDADVAQRMRRITLNYHALELLGRERYELDSGLPWPLGIIDAVRPGLAACA